MTYQQDWYCGSSRLYRIYGSGAGAVADGNISVGYTGIYAGCVVSVRLIMGSGGLYYISRTSTGK